LDKEIGFSVYETVERFILSERIEIIQFTKLEETALSLLAQRKGAKRGLRSIGAGPCRSIAATG
jgi:hypothetical protein